MRKIFLIFLVCFLSSIVFASTNLVSYSGANGHACKPGVAGCNYAYSVLIPDAQFLDCATAGATTVLRLSTPTNAHVQTNAFSTYLTSICMVNNVFSAGTCNYTSAGANCGAGYTCQFGLSSTSNAHISSCGSFGTSEIKFCCNFPAIVPGVCGSAVGNYVVGSSFPGGYSLCSSAGGSSPVSPVLGSSVGDSNSWVCLGSGGGVNSGSCVASRVSAAVPGVCGSAVGNYVVGAVFPGGYSLCSSAGGSSPVSPVLGSSVGDSNSWVCLGSGGGVNSGSCVASRVSAAVPGVCGSAVGNYVVGAVFPGGYSLCSSAGGSSPVSPVLGSSVGDSNSWVCLGSGGGVNSGSCVASRVSAAVPGVCGSAVGNYVVGAVFPGGYSLCSSAGGSSPVSPVLGSSVGDSNSWVCLGSGGGVNSGSCVASRVSNSVANNSIIDFNAAYSPDLNSITFFAKCLLLTNDANVVLSEDTTNYFNTLQNNSCSLDGNSFVYSNATVPINKVVSLTLRIPTPCIVCEKTIFLPIIKSGNTSSIPDSNPLIAIVVLVSAVLIIFNTRNKRGVN